MRIYKKVYKVPNSYQRVPFEKVKKAVENIVDHVNISSLTAAKKFQFKNRFISDVKKRSEIIGDGKVGQKDLSKAFRESLKEKTLPNEWVTKRYMDLITKGGKSLSSKWETASDVKGTNAVQKAPIQSRKLDTIEKITDFHERLKKSIEARKKMLLPSELRVKEEDGKTKMNRADTETIPENMGQKITPDKNSTALKSGGKDRVDKKSLSNMPAKKVDNRARQAMPLMRYRQAPSAVPPPTKNEIPDIAVPEFIAVDSDKKLNPDFSGFNQPDNQLNMNKGAEIPEWKLAAYPKTSEETAESVKDNFTEKDSELGGQENDSFGESDQKYT